MKRLYKLTFVTICAGCILAALHFATTASAQGENKNYKHVYMILSANFEVEAVLDAYIATYPGGLFSEYTVLFKGENERPATPYSYIILIPDLNQKTTQLGFWDFAEAWLKLNRGKWIAVAAKHSAFPDVYGTGVGESRVRVYGEPTVILTPSPTP